MVLIEYHGLNLFKDQPLFKGVLLHECSSFKLGANNLCCQEQLWRQERDKNVQDFIQNRAAKRIQSGWIAHQGKRHDDEQEEVCAAPLWST